MARMDQDPAPLTGPARRTVLRSLGTAGAVAAASSLVPGRASAATAGEAGIDWSQIARVSKTTATLQVVVNALIRRESPIHDNVFAEIRALHADYVRFVPWFPYPRLGVAELEAPTSDSTSWDFTLIDPLVEDFVQATRGHTTIMNFSTTPEWMWEGGWTVQDGQLTALGGDNGVAKEGFDWTDYTFAADVTPLATATVGDQPYAQAGMLFRMNAAGAGYAFLLSNYPYTSPASPGYVVFVSFGDGGGVSGVQVTALPIAVVGGQTYQVAITVAGDTFTCAVNGATAATVTSSAVAAGTVGFREDGAESARFASVQVTAADGTVLLSDDFSDGLDQWTGPVLQPDDPDAVDFNYSQGSQLLVPVQTVAEYYGRLVAWYTRGGFTDEIGAFHKSEHHYSFPYWEVLNELEHGLSPQLYTQLYDAIVTEIGKVSPHTKFVGLALAQGSQNPADISYFLNPANHAAGVPIDLISYHFYASPSGSDPTTYASTFAQADAFLAQVDQIETIRMQLAPHVRTTVDETGSILDIAATQADPAPVPDAYWNFSGAMYAYVFASLALKGIDIVGESQMVGYPGQFPSVSMVDWNTGLPNARYRVLQLLLEELPPGSQLVQPPATPAGYFMLGYLNAGGHVRKVLVVNKTDTAVSVPMPGAGHNARARVVDQDSAGGPIRTEQTAGDQFTLGGYGVAIVTLHG